MPEFRDRVRESDADAVRALVGATGFFSAAEVAIAGELVEEAVARGPAAGYRFLFAEQAERLDGYSCFGPIPLTLASFDLYWIAVQPDLQGRGLGRRLLGESESVARAAGAAAVYADTSSRPQYAPTRAFYRAAGYVEAADFPDFYAPGDGKIVFVKRW